MITFWNQLGSQWQTLMVPLLFQGSLAIVVVWAIGSCWPKLPASKRHWLWRLAYIKLLVLVCWQSPLKLPVLPPPTTPIPITNPTHAAIASPTLQRSDFLPRSAPRNLELATPETKLAPQKEVAADNRPNVAAILGTLWLFGVVAYLGRAITLWWKTKRLRKEGQTLAATPLHDQFVTTCRELNIRSAPRLLSHSSVNSPLVVGCLHPTVIIPTPDKTNLSSSEAKLIFAHELAHIARHDLWWGWLRVLTESLTFFNPLVWLARRHWNLTQEMACDETVITRTQVSTSIYQTALLRTIEQNSSSRQLPQNAMALGVSGSFRDMKERLIAMNQIKTRSPFYHLTIAALLAAMALTGIVPYQLVAKSENEGQRTSDSLFGDVSQKSKEKPQPVVESKPSISIFNGTGTIEQEVTLSLEPEPQIDIQVHSEVLSPVIQGLAIALKSDRPEVRARVVEALAELKDPATVPLLLEALKDEHDSVRHEALHGLEDLPDTRAVAAVSELLGSDDWKERRQAIEILEDISHPEAMNHLLSALNDPHHKNRLQAIDAIEDHEIVVPLSVLDPVLHDEHWQVRRKAVETLGELESPEAIEPLIQALNDEHPGVRKEAREALQDLEHSLEPEVFEVHPDLFNHPGHDVFADRAESVQRFADLDARVREAHQHEREAAHRQREAQQRQREARQRQREADRRRQEMASRQERQTRVADLERENLAALADTQRELAARETDRAREFAPNLARQRDEMQSALHHAEEALVELQAQPFQTELQSAQIESIVNSVLKRVNAQVEKAIAEAMADLRKETRSQSEPKDKRGTDPFENSAGTAQSY